MQHDDLSYLTDILQAAKLVVSFVQDVDEQAFSQDVMRQSAVIRQIEVMGEATKRLSDSIRNEQPGISWRKIAGMRDILIHAYDHVDIAEVWNTATVAIPQLIKQIEQLTALD